jgi:hypothetical protein
MTSNTAETDSCVGYNPEAETGPSQTGPSFRSEKQLTLIILGGGCYKWILSPLGGTLHTG